MHLDLLLLLWEENDNVGKGNAPTESKGDGKGKYAKHVDNSAQTHGKWKNAAIEGKCASFVRKRW